MKSNGLPDYSNHPAVIFGKWLKDKRIDKGQFVCRTMANFIGMDIRKYSEVERGIGDWLDDKYIDRIVFALDLNNQDRVEFNRLVDEMKESTVLQMTDLYTRDQMRPAFPPTKNWTIEKEEALLDMVFKPLE